MTTEESLGTLVRLAYEGAAEPGKWQEFLRALAESVNATSTVLVVHDFADGSASVGINFGLDPAWAAAYEQYYAARNLWNIRGADLFTPGSIKHGNLIVSDDELVRTEFYNDFLRPNHFFYSFGGVIAREGAVTCYVTALRPHAAGAFGDAESSVLALLLPHLDCALRLHRRIAALERTREMLGGALDTIPYGLILVDAAGRVLTRNRVAAGIFAQHDGISERQGHVEIALGREMRRLRGLVGRAVTTGSGRGLEAGGVMLVSRPSFRHPYQLLIVPVPLHSTLLETKEAGALIVVTDPDLRPHGGEDAIASLFDLTAAEARLAMALVRGRSIEDASEEFGVSLNTARTHLKRIFDKTGTGRQAELVRVLMSGPAAWHRADEHAH